MAKDENGGLLSRVVKFVRNPTTNWSDLDQQETDRESTYSKQMLKEMIERKRRNDFVRKREFDMLRKMRRSEVMAGQDPTARPSFFQSSMPSKPDDRAMTLKKIDEIEAQMSMQWWKTKHGDSSVRSTNFPINSSEIGSSTTNSVPPERARKGVSYTQTEPSPLRTEHTAGDTAPPMGTPGSQAEPMMNLDLLQPDAPTTQPNPQPTAQPATVAQPVRVERAAPPVAPPPSAPVRVTVAGSTARPPAAAAAAGHAQGGATTGFSASKLFAVDVEEFAHDPELEEAAIRFANGDDQGAEAGLLEVLAPKGARVKHDETWLALFDLYRATGQHEPFESAAIDFAGLFGRSAPLWFSMPELVGRMGSQPVEATEAQQATDWNSPGSFGTQSLAALNAALAKATQPFRLNWTRLVSIEDAAVEPLTKLFTQWSGQTVQLRFIGAHALEKHLQDATPSGDASVNTARWRLRMEVLRVMHRPDEFELVALDYCVTYEVSPPSWESARCEFKSLQADGSSHTGHTIIGEAFRDSQGSGMNTTYGDTQYPTATAQQANISTVELAGQILGDATDALVTLEDRLKGADVMVISCSRLIRIDFSAAGTLLNWVTARQTEGRQVQFSEVHRLVAAFFNVIGISEHARVVTRVD